MTEHLGAADATDEGSDQPSGKHVQPGAQLTVQPGHHSQTQHRYHWLFPCGATLGAFVLHSLQAANRTVCSLPLP